MMCDNQDAIALIKNSIHFIHTKYIDIQHHFICEKVEHGVIEMKYVSTQCIITDVLTKTLPKSQQKPLHDEMGLTMFGNK